MQSFTSIDFDKSLDIRNAEHAKPCRGAKYLLCIFGPTEDILIAKSWHRAYPKRKPGEVVVLFNEEPK